MRRSSSQQEEDPLAARALHDAMRDILESEGRFEVAFEDGELLLDVDGESAVTA
jgi:hypothetical protein